MDYKYFHDGLISLSTTLFIFSLSFLFSSILLKPYIALEPDDRDLIVLLTIINMIFSIYYLIEAFNLERVFRLEEKYIRNFGIRIAVVSLLYLPHIFVFISLLLLHLHNLQKMLTRHLGCSCHFADGISSLHSVAVVDGFNVVETGIVPEAVNQRGNFFCRPAFSCHF